MVNGAFTLGDRRPPVRIRSRSTLALSAVREYREPVMALMNGATMHRTRTGGSRRKSRCRKRSTVRSVTLSTTTEAAMAFKLGSATAGSGLSAPAVQLAEGGLRAMTLMKMKTTLAALVAIGVIAAGVGLLGQKLRAVDPDAAQAVVHADPAAPPP